MIRLLITGAALAVVSPALAQQAEPADPANPVGTTAADPAAAQTAPAGTAGASQPAGATTAAQPANNATQVAAVVDSEFPVYDADKSGQLDKAEFSKWIIALKREEIKTTGQALPEAQLTAWASSAFTAADADKNSNVTKAELTSYLGG